MPSLSDTLKSGYAFTGPTITLGAGMVGTDLVTEPKVRLPLAMMNRHGLIAGATGTGKTKTLQLIAEQLSMQGVPVFVADLKGDLSGIAMPGEASPRVAERATSVGYEWKPAGSPVEFVSLSGKLGVQLRATVSSFGPLLLAKVLELNETQESVLTLVFKFCDDQGLPLLDFKDLRAILQFLTSDEGKPALAQYGGMASTTVGVLLRKMIELETQGAEQFFGEPEFDVRDLLHVGSDGRGVVTCLELADVQDKPRLFSTFMMWMLAELFQNLPEAGDLEKPKLCFFFDEAHLLFADASKAFLEQVQQVIRLIRSKGVGVYFITQSPKDVPDDVLGQLGNRVQHALRAHTPDEEAALRAAVRTFPKTDLYDLQQTLMSLGIGEAVITGLDGRGVPTPVVACRLIPPASRMAPLTPDELQADIRQSDFVKEYGQAVDRESAFEMLAKRLQTASGRGGKTAREPRGPFGSAPQEPPPAKSSGKVGKGMGAVIGGAIAGTLASRAGRALGTALVRGVFGMLTGRAPRGTSRTRW
ncbi:MAG TPA: helicase HerA-like domain-containing protein [Gemmatimonadales bacterium]|nr:helicase HerA-like domain-containing protein [Gemmatimonadales bacterium]